MRKSVSNITSFNAEYLRMSGILLLLTYLLTYLLSLLNTENNGAVTLRGGATGGDIRHIRALQRQGAGVPLLCI